MKRLRAGIQFFTLRVLLYLIPGVATGVGALVALLEASHVTVVLAGLTLLLVALGFAGPPVVDWLRGREASELAQVQLATSREREQDGLLAVQLRDHFEPRGRGILPSQVRDGSFFTGRVKILSELSGWLGQADPADYRARVVTGGPGSGKSAALGRLVCLANPRLRSEWANAAGDDARAETVPPPGITMVAVHARGRTVDEVAAQIAYGLGVDEVSAAALLAALRTRFDGRWRARSRGMRMAGAYVAR